MTATGIPHETRLLGRRCRCGTPLTEPAKSCLWHAHGSATYAADLNTYIAFLHKPTRGFSGQLMALSARMRLLLRGKVVNLYMFEYIQDGKIRRVSVRAVDSLDAFNAFRIDHPSVPIANVWVEAFQGAS